MDDNLESSNSILARDYSGTVGANAQQMTTVGQDPNVCGCEPATLVNAFLNSPNGQDRVHKFFNRWIEQERDKISQDASDLVDSSALWIALSIVIVCVAMLAIFLAYTYSKIRSQTNLKTRNTRGGIQSAASNQARSQASSSSAGSSWVSQQSAATGSSVGASASSGPGSHPVPATKRPAPAALWQQQQQSPVELNLYKAQPEPSRSTSPMMHDGGVSPLSAVFGVDRPNESPTTPNGPALTPTPEQIRRQLGINSPREGSDSTRRKARAWQQQQQ